MLENTNDIAATATPNERKTDRRTIGTEATAIPHITLNRMDLRYGGGEGGRT